MAVQVAEIAYFDSNPAPEDGASQHRERNVYLEGYCLVHYQDGTVAQVLFLPAQSFHPTPPRNL